MKPLIDTETARRLIFEHVPHVPAVACPLAQCAGRVLRQTIHADRPFPPFNRAMMDGYAIRASDISVVDAFTVTTQIAAGTPEAAIGAMPGACAEIMTGAVVPRNADCVLPYEATQRIDQNTMRLQVETTHAAGDYIHPLGSDHPAGQDLLHPGVRLNCHAIAVAATCGYSELQASAIPSIAIISSGDELVDIDDQPAPHQIRRSNDIAIEAALANAQLPARVRSHLPDAADIVQAQLERLIQDHDFVILSGGISKGKKDYIPSALEALGMDCHFHGVAQQPGKPMGFWTNDRCAVFALPGNPISTLSCLHHYVIPGMHHAQHRNAPALRQTVKITQAAPVRKDLTVFLPVTRKENNQAVPCPSHNSGDLVSILASDGYIIIPAGIAEVTVGSSYCFYPWH